MDAQWKQTNGPYGGTIWALLAHNNYLFVGVPDKGIYRSSDNGQSWVLSNTGLKSYGITCLTTNGNDIYAGIFNGGVFRSTNNGDTWTEKNSGLSNMFVMSLAVSGNSVFAGCQFFGSSYTTLLFRSSNNGDSWEKADSGLYKTGNFPHSVKYMALNGAFVFASTDSGVYRSVINESKWTKIMSGNSQPMQPIITKGDTIFLGAWNKGIFRSIDNGNSWVAVNTGIPYNPYQGYYAASIKSFAISNGNIFAGGSNQLFRSTDGGNSWTNIFGQSNYYINCIVVQSNYFYLGTQADGVLLLTNNGTDVNLINTGIINTSIHCLTSLGSTIFAGGMGLCISTNNGDTWTNTAPIVNGQNILCLATYGNIIYMGTNNFVYRSTDNGSYWSKIGLSTTHAYNCFSILVNNNDIFVGTAEAGVFYSSNNGEIWSQVNTGLTTLDVRTLILSDSNIFVGTYGGGVYRSSNKGASWTPVSNGLTNSNILSLINASNTIFAGTEHDGVFRSTDKGGNWIDVFQAVRNYYSLYSYFYARAFLIDNDKIVSVGSPYGVIYSTDQGNSWQSKNSGLSNPEIQTITRNDENVFIGTTSSGVWKRPLSEVLTEVENKTNIIPTGFILKQNYPNPFNPTTTISFTLPSKSFVSLKIFDVMGREVSILIDEELSAGKQTRQWNAVDVASGMYFYQLKAGSFTETKKLLLLR